MKEKMHLYQKQMTENITRLMKSYITGRDFLENPKDFLSSMGFAIDEPGLREIKKLKELADMGKFEAQMVDMSKLGTAIHPEVASSTSSATSSMTSSATSSGI